MIYTVEFDFEDFFDTPQIQIGIDGTVYYNQSVQEQISFEAVLSNGPHTLWIQHWGKKIEWTTAEHDHHVFVKKIYFDNVDLDQLDYHPITHKGRFYPDYEQSYRDTCQQQNLTLPEYISPNHYLGHNGIWKLDFEAPELLWIIKEQNPSGIHLEDTIFSTGSTTLNQVKKFFDL